MFNKILFATTASPACDNAAKVAFDLELKWDAKLYVFHVLGIPSRGYSPFVTDVRTGEITEPDPDYVDWVKEEMKNTYGTLLEDSENSVIEAAVGVPYREILRKARRKMLISSLWAPTRARRMSVPNAIATSSAVRCRKSLNPPAARW